jgi:hypothetical protein
MVEAANALPGREREIEVPALHEVLGTPLKGPFPEGFQQAVFGMGCFWGEEKVFWEAPGVYTTAVGYAGGFTPNPTYEEVCSGATGHTEAVLAVFDPAATSYEQLLKLFWEGHDPTQGMRQGKPVPLGDLLAGRGPTRRGRGLARCLPAGPHGRRPRHDHDRDRAGRAGPSLLLRRGLPPAVPREAPGRLLRRRRHRRELPGGAHLTTPRRPWRRPRSLACIARHASCVLARNDEPFVRSQLTKQRPRRSGAAGSCGLG